MNQKGFINIVVIIGIVVIAGIAGYFVLSQRTTTPPVPTSTPTPPISTSTTPTQTSTTTTSQKKNKVSPQIYNLSPSSSTIGTSVTIKGSGFTATQNVVRFGTDYSGYLNSADGVTLSFAVPAEQDECHPGGSPCYEIRNIPVTAGRYEVYVMNTNGESNKHFFYVTDSQVGYNCRVVCTGARPSSKVEQDCIKLLSQEQCISYSSGEFPFKCEWQTTNYQCALP
ncbi:hypothetical protein A3C75_01275 [Candidatus Giovannonibacteria bacterium RIFCSPHIGHO2_02_FULL_44_31]|uniref:IPT/TIG domain-containing protein n=1 Tax=uncultured Parcubacteria bacterium Rifle_16ft_4_minimus_37658 TaxID=1665141 RepID=A0A0H4TPJ8_9BACT|nr:hypothetical protein [uncultured Parcubacteria bacterium Rifle_16ft_4_minimus_37658]OGF69956.1 MAG: hypothetical protein A3C75_01275 [Candidatus Giovannonibacteria bacterium RIFCSPHIGHO2_02_FULL_44_31]